jgi:hypothetical protein
MTNYIANNSVPLDALPTTTGVVRTFRAGATNDGASTYAPDGLAVAPIFGLGGQPLQGGEIVRGGVATLVSFVGPLLNSGNLCWVLLSCDGGAQQVAPAQQSMQALQFGQLTGLVGAMSSAKMSVTTTSPTPTFTADEVVVATALNGLQTLLTNFSETIDLGTTGIGGVVGPALTANGFAGLYAVWGPTVGTGIIAVNGNSRLPKTFAGALPAGFTSSALVGVWRLNADRRFARGHQRGRKFTFPVEVPVSTITATATPTSVSIAATVPPNAGEVAGILVSEGSVTGAILQLSVSADSIASGAKESAGIATVGVINVAPFSLVLATDQTMFYSATVSQGSLNINIRISEYSI